MVQLFENDIFSLISKLSRVHLCSSYPVGCGIICIIQKYKTRLSETLSTNPRKLNVSVRYEASTFICDLEDVCISLRIKHEAMIFGFLVLLCLILVDKGISKNCTGGFRVPNTCGCHRV